MGALKAVVVISGRTTGDVNAAVSISGDVATQELSFDGTLFVEKDTSVVPPRVKVGVRVDPEAPSVYDLNSRLTEVEATVDGLDEQLIILQSAETVTLVPWAASITLDWNALATRHVKLTPDGTATTIGAPTNMVEGLDYRLTIDNLASTASSCSFSSDWDTDSPPWNVIFGGPIPSFNGDPEIFTFTFRYVGGKMRLINACFGNDA